MVAFARMALTSLAVIGAAGGTCAGRQQRECRELGDQVSQLMWGTAITDQRTRDQFMARCESWPLERVRCIRGMADPGDWPDCDYGRSHHDARAALRTLLGRSPCTRPLQPLDALRPTSDAGTAFEATFYSADLRNSYLVRCEGQACDCAPGPGEGRCRAFFNHCLESGDGGRNLE